MGGNGRSVDEIASGLSSYMDPQEIKAAIRDLRNTGEKSAVNHIRQFLKHKDASIRYMAKKAIDDLSKGLSSSAAGETPAHSRKTSSGPRRPGIVSRAVSFIGTLVKWTLVLGMLGGISYGGYLYRDRIVPVALDIYAVLARKGVKNGENSPAGSQTSAPGASVEASGAETSRPEASTPETSGNDGSIAANAPAAPPDAVASAAKDPAAGAGETVPPELLAQINDFYGSLSAAYNEKAIDKFMDHFDTAGTFKAGGGLGASDMSSYRDAANLEFTTAPEVKLKVDVIEVRRVSEEEYAARVSAVYTGTFEGSPLDSRFMAIRRNDTMTKRQGAWKLAGVSY